MSLLLNFQECVIPVCNPKSNADHRWETSTCCSLLGSMEMTTEGEECGWQRERRGEGSAWVGNNPQRGPKSWKKQNKKKRGSHTHGQSAVTMLMPGPLWTCLILMWLESSSAHSLFTCEPIKVHRCLGLSYNMTFFPNMMDHFDQDIAATSMKVSINKKSHQWNARVWCDEKQSLLY